MHYKFVMFGVICYHLYNFRNVKNAHGGVLLHSSMGVFVRSLNCANDTKSRNASHPCFATLLKSHFGMGVEKSSYHHINLRFRWYSFLCNYILADYYRLICFLPTLFLDAICSAFFML